MSGFFGSNSTTVHPVLDEDSDWMMTVFPMLTFVALFLYLLSLCYKALRDGADQHPQNDRDGLALV